MTGFERCRATLPAGAGRLALAVVMLVSAAAAPRTAGGTALAVAWSPDEVVIAADSRRTRGVEDPQVLSACKIRREGETYWTAAGIHSDSRAGHDVGRLVGQAVRREPTFERRVDAVEGALVRPLQAALVRLRREAPTLFEADHDGSSALDVVLVAFEGGTARLAVLSFVASAGRAGHVDVRVKRRGCPGPECGRESQVVIVGGEGHARRLWSTRRDELSLWRPANLVELLVQEEIDRGAPDVGPPIDLLRVRRHGHRWLQAKDACRDLAAAAPPESTQADEAERHRRVRGRR